MINSELLKRLESLEKINSIVPMEIFKRQNALDKLNRLSTQQLKVMSNVQKCEYLNSFLPIRNKLITLYDLKKFKGIDNFYSTHKSYLIQHNYLKNVIRAYPSLEYLKSLEEIKNLDLSLNYFKLKKNKAWQLSEEFDSIFANFKNISLPKQISKKFTEDKFEDFTIDEVLTITKEDPSLEVSVKNFKKSATWATIQETLPSNIEFKDETLIFHRMFFIFHLGPSHPDIALKIYDLLVKHSIRIADYNFSELIESLRTSIEIFKLKSTIDKM